jgi:hypothetical protein
MEGIMCLIWIKPLNDSKRLVITCKDILRYIKKYKLSGTHYNAIKGAIVEALKERK